MNNRPFLICIYTDMRNICVLHISEYATVFERIMRPFLIPHISGISNLDISQTFIVLSFIFCAAEEFTVEVRKFNFNIE